MDGLNFIAPSGIIDKYFDVDQYGLICPRQDALDLSAAEQRLSRLLKSQTDLSFKLAERYYLTDVETTDNPLGNTNAIGAGVRMFGTQPLKKMKFSGRLDFHQNDSAGVKQRLAKRERRIEEYLRESLDLHKSQEPADKDSYLYTLWEIEHDQALTGGGFDNNHIGDVTNTALKGMLKTVELPQIANSTVSEKFVASCIEFRDYLVSQGLSKGSLQPDGLSKVRFEQDNDGMFGFPVLKKGGAPLDNDIATRLLIERGVDCRKLVGTVMHDSNSNSDYPFRIQDALAYILDHMGPTSISDFQSIIVLLARIQKHGFKEEDGKYVPKDGKARAVFPNSAIEACIEGMLINPYIRTLQEKKVPCFPSLQTKPVRVSMIKDWEKTLSSDGYGFLAADWSQYDATVPGWGLATVIQYCVKPFYNSKYHDWVDLVTYLLVYKYFLIDDDLARINMENYTGCINSVPNVGVEKWRLFALKDYLISGAKFTHIGGSEYGICSIHLTIPKLLGFPGKVGPQGGDDTLMAFPKSQIYLDDQKKTYTPISTAGKELGLDLNVSKQIFYSYQDELVGIFLQDSYCVAADSYGIGSAYRPYAALFTSERNRGLSVAEQLMAEVSRMNQGSDSPFIDAVVEKWLSQEQFLGVLVREKGAEAAFQLLVDAVGYPVEEIAKRIGVGSFTYSISIDDLRSGKLPILSVMDRVASNLSLSVSIDKALESLGVAEQSKSDLDNPDSTPDEEDILDD